MVMVSRRWPGRIAELSRNESSKWKPGFYPPGGGMNAGVPISGGIPIAIIFGGRRRARRSIIFLPWDGIGPGLSPRLCLHLLRRPCPWCSGLKLFPREDRLPRGPHLGGLTGEE